MEDSSPELLSRQSSGKSVFRSCRGRQVLQRCESHKDTLKGEIEEGLRLTGADIAHAEVAHGQLWRRFQAFLEKYEYFVLPTTQLPSFDVNTPFPTEIAGVKFDNYIDWMKSCWYVSAPGNPAASVPRASRLKDFLLGADRRPRQEDFSVLQIAHAFEQATRFGKSTRLSHNDALQDSTGKGEVFRTSSESEFLLSAKVSVARTTDVWER